MNLGGVRFNRLRPLLLAWILALSGTALSQVLPTQDGAARAPDEWLLAKNGPAWWYRAKPSDQPAELGTRSPTPAEKEVIERARALMGSRPIRALALVDGANVVFSDYSAPASSDSVFFGFSMGKTVTAMAVGAAVCAGKLRLNVRASELLPQLAGKPLGDATVRDLLRMASGAAPGDRFGNVMTAADLQEWQAGNINLAELVAREKIAQAERGVFSSYAPGEHFAYKNNDPMVLGLMINEATGMPHAQWVQKTIFDPMGMANAGFVVQDRFQHTASDAGVRLRLDDWIRFAWWVKQASKGSGCFADFVRDAARTQISNGWNSASRKTGGLFGEALSYTSINNRV